MRRETTGGLVAALMLAPLLAGCGPDWQPSWNMSSTPAIPGDGLTVRRVAGEDAPFEPVRSQDIEQLRLTVGALLTSRPTSPEAAMTRVPDYSPVPRPDLERQMAPPGGADATPVRPRGSSTPPPVASVPPPSPPPRTRVPAAPPVPEPERVEGRVLNIPGQPPAVVTGGSGRVQSITQPGNPAGGVAIQDGGTTTVIQPGGRVTTVPTPR
ncbi:hypothetical protein [Neoroseomonas oryzicola]|uniref:Uncharacterized protein n=1 Tax=Neoroseomonas oryzicola TaxID=535904 RepID=A0A9X9WKY5_9PROT|nr:hypothetical protein [Neoroseomonas oryzicola]MBR0660995.1 hypothetical protein [Neoroseomonas oryzicola]NKE19214.1 hypothetical protein [Neoroseomonas oryzicola]